MLRIVSSIQWLAGDPYRQTIGGDMVLAWAGVVQSSCGVMAS
jgi:hypothetical protein